MSTALATHNKLKKGRANMNNTNITLEKLLHERVSAFASSDTPAKIIDKHVEKMFSDVIENAFRSYGDMGKAVSEAVKAALPSNISDMFELTRYNALIANSIKQAWNSSGVEADMLRRANAALEAALKDEAIPEKVSLRELLEAFVEEHKEEAVENQWERPEIRFEDSNYGGGLHIYFDEKPEEEAARGSRMFGNTPRSNYSLKNAIHVRWRDVDFDSDKVGEVYSAKIDDDPIGKNFSIHTRWERLIVALYFGCAKLVIDCDSDDFSYGIYD